MKQNKTKQHLWLWYVTFFAELRLEFTERQRSYVGLLSQAVDTY